jgi:hypothetical protein
VGDAFKALLLDHDSDHEKEDSPPALTFFTSAESFLTQPDLSIPYAKELVNSLNNQAFVHQLTTQSPANPLELPDHLE